MIRIVIENLLLFLAPTLLYLAFVYIKRREHTTASAVMSDAPIVWLCAAGAALVVITLVVFGSTSGGRPGQGYEPPSMHDGKIEQGHRK
jgi:hypothetical protein